MNGLLGQYADWSANFLATLGGTTVILGALFGWLGKRYLDKTLELERRTSATTLQQVKGSKEKRIHVYKAQFELEFKAYQDIWIAFSVLREGVARFTRLYSGDLRPGEGTKRDYANKARAAFYAAAEKFRSYEPFISEDIADVAAVCIRLCNDEIEAFYVSTIAEERKDETYKPELALEASREFMKDLLDKFNILIALVRDRMKALSVIDP
jgi:hypothetical protein